MQVTRHPNSRQSWPPPAPRPTPRQQAEEAVKFWVMVLLIVTISFILLSRYLLHIRRESNSEDDEWINSPTDAEHGQNNPQFFVGQYRDDDGSAPSYDSASSIPNELNNLNSSRNDGPYEAGVRVLSSFDSSNHNRTPTPHLYSYQPPAAGLTNVKEIQRLVAQLNRIKDGSNPESEENSSRIKAIQQRITELVMTDPRYDFVRSSTLPLDPPPAYSDTTN